MINRGFATVAMLDGNAGPAPGKTGTHKYHVQYSSTPDDKPLDSMGDLYRLEGNVEVVLEDGDTIVDRRDTPFSMAELLKDEAPGSSGN